MALIETVNGHVHSYTRVYPNGTVGGTSVQKGNTATYRQYSKQVAPSPAFKPGSFNVKPYMVTEFRISESPSEAHGTTTLSDGSTQHHVWTYKGGPSTAAVNALEKNVPNLAAATALAMQEAYAKVDAAIWDVGVDLAEINEVADLIPSLIKGPRKLAELGHDVFDFARAVGRKSGSVSNHTFKQLTKQIGRTGSELPQQAADMWLTYRYGLMPALLSVNDALEMLAKKLEKADAKIRTKRRRKSFKDKRMTLGNSSTKPYTLMYETMSRLEAIVYYRRRVDQTTMGQLGLVPSNIPSILWETTRLSFVADWIVNIGKWLEALKPKFDVDILGYTTSHSHEQKHGIIQLNPWYDQKSMKYISFPSKPVFYYGKTFQRSVTDGPSLLPVFTGLSNMNLDRAIDSAALALKPLIKKIKQLRK